MEKAKKYFKMALMRRPDRPAAVLELAEIAYKQHNIDLAGKYMRRYKAIAKQSAQSTWLFYRLKIKQKLSRQAEIYAAILKKEYPESQEYKLYKSGAV